MRDAATPEPLRRVWIRRLHSDEWVDEVRITTVPRFKESDLSGDEWRTSARVEFLRKGVVVAHESYHDIHAALAYIARHAVGTAPASWKDSEYGEHGLTPAEHAAQVRHLDEALCAQPGCPEEWVNEYSQTRGTEVRGASVVEPSRYHDVHRRFCARHSHRGDSNLDDMDDNYVLTVTRERLDGAWVEHRAPA